MPAPERRRNPLRDSQLLHLTLFGVALWYHFTFAVISISLLGIAAGAVRCYMHFLPAAPTSDGPAPWEMISRRLTFLSISVALPILLMSLIVATPTFSLAGAVVLAVYFIVCALRFYTSG